MKTATIIICAGVLMATTAFVTAQVASQDSKQNPARDKAQDAQMQQWMKYSTPSHHHKKLETYIGDWDQTVKMWWYPGSEPQVSKSTATYKWIMDGRFVQGEYLGEFNGQEFRGMDLLGYDNFRKQYITLWIDNMTTAFMTSHGKFNAAGTKLQMQGISDDPMTGAKDKPFKTTTQFVDENTMVYEIHGPGPDGTYFKTLEVTSTRKMTRK